MKRAITDLLADAHRARMEVRRIEREMRACQCQHEVAFDFCSAWTEDETEPLGIRPMLLDRSGQAYEFIPEDVRPCWKGTWEDVDERGRRYYPEGDCRDEGWCDPCRKREQIRKELAPARRRLAGLKSAIWAAANRAAEQTEPGAKS